MIGIDANIALRYLLKDDPALSTRALEIIAANDCFVTRAALTEVVYTLESYYRRSRADTGTCARRRGQPAAGLNRGQRRDRAGGVLALVQGGGMDFGDAMIAASSQGSVRVETFDRDFARLARKLRTAPPVEFAVK